MRTGARRRPGGSGRPVITRLAKPLGILGAMLAAGPAATQQPPPPIPDSAAQDTAAPRPFVPGGVYDRPYLGRLLGRTAIGGYAEAHGRFERVDGITEELGFVVKRFNLFTATTVSDFVRIGAELEFEEGGEEVRLEYAAIDVLVHPAFTVRGGMILSPLGRFNLAHDSPLNPFTDRPLVSTELLGVALSEPGFGALGGFDTGGTARLTYEIYATNGFHDGVLHGAPEGTRVAAGRTNFEDNNASPAVVGRLAWSPAVGYELGLSAHHGAYNVFQAGGEAIAPRRDLTIRVLDLEAEIIGVRLNGEAAAVDLDVGAGFAGIAASRQRGLFLDAERVVWRGLLATMPGSTLSLKARVDAVDFDADRPGDSVLRLTAGLNIRPTADTVLKIEYARGRARDGFNSPAEAAAIFFSLASYF